RSVTPPPPTCSYGASSMSSGNRRSARRSTRHRSCGRPAPWGSSSRGIPRRSPSASGCWSIPSPPPEREASADSWPAAVPTSLSSCASSRCGVTTSPASWRRRSLASSASAPTTPCPSSRGVLPRLLGDRLVDELAEQLLELALPRAGLRLSHQDGDELLLGIDPERGAAGAAPIELARRARRAVQTIGAADGEAKPEAVSGRQEMSRLDVAEMVGRHVTHDRTREQSLAVQL